MIKCFSAGYIISSSHSIMSFRGVITMIFFKCLNKNNIPKFNNHLLYLNMDYDYFVHLT